MLLVPVCNPSAIAQMIIYIVNHPEEALIKRKKAEKILKNLTDLIENNFAELLIRRSEELMHIMQNNLKDSLIYADRSKSN